ncbi:hypothetical protein K2173_023790 [Erythroxylum novogranatense]|uniref:DEK-C domain-containing protein n=1 Tax=Erythroxylum novogranatense TaxID=1862640 RepID=A0AAV8TIG1_9ROSI|nr:hypothetical protein K2173_023790 [Erythroxylum novogranatense]
MGEKESDEQIQEALTNGTVASENSLEAVIDRNDEQNNGVKEMEEDKDHGEKVETERMDDDTKPKEDEIKQVKEKQEGDEEKEAKVAAVEEHNWKEEDKGAENQEENKKELEDKDDKLSKEEEEDEDENDKEKVSRKHGKRKSVGGKVDRKKKAAGEKKEPEPKTPFSHRPQRERKSVERLVASIEKDAAKEFHIQKGQGTPLKDIPNVAFKLSRRKMDDTFKLLHSILFGRRGKAVQIKSNISRFSGFVWHENEEKQKIKVKEKFDKCNKEKLLEFCDILDISIAKATTKKEDIVTKLIDFLVAPHATTTVLLAEKEKGSKSNKRKRVSKSSKRSAKRGRKAEDVSRTNKKSPPETEDESDEEKEEEEEQDENVEDENENGISEKPDTEVPEHSESEEKNESEEESEEETRKGKRSSTVAPRKESAGKAKTKKITFVNKASPPPKRAPKKSLSKRIEKVSSRKKDEKTAKKSSTPTKADSKERAGKKVVKGKGSAKGEKLGPSDDELRDAICEIFKEVDFNTATFTDILKLLARHFDMDLTPRKSAIKVMIQEELTKLADEAEDDDDDDDDGGDGEKDKIQSAGQEVEA